MGRPGNYHVLPGGQGTRPDQTIPLVLPPDCIADSYLDPIRRTGVGPLVHRKIAQRTKPAATARNKTSVIVIIAQAKSTNHDCLA
jgi:hypothetical protein